MVLRFAAELVFRSLLVLLARFRPRLLALAPFEPSLAPSPLATLPSPLLSPPSAVLLLALPTMFP
ncbi:hypothetical protein LB505_008739 [Fusarium chuoi]|nr:hypothetical protein LB505_008739 [Fusarium chuoi]